MNDKTHGLNSETVLKSFPTVLADSKSLLALGTVIAFLAKRHHELIESVNIYASLPRTTCYLRTSDGLLLRTADGIVLCVDYYKHIPETLLDIMAYDFKVDWWDADYSIDEKRQVLIDSWDVHRHLGTKGAVVQAISAIYPETSIEEWFEYDGEPYHFRIKLDVTSDSVNPTKHQRVIERIERYKNVRSVLDDIEYAAGSAGRAYAVISNLGEEIEDEATAYIR